MNEQPPIGRIAIALQRHLVGEARAAELGIEVSRLNDAILDAAGRLTIQDEPGAFPVILEQDAR